jgi:glycosyltransferase involved in cell wall biosynthesis
MKNKSRPLVSIGMPVYNGEKYIRQAFDSLLAQDFKDFELIISDNASTDNTTEICKQYLEKDNRIKYYRNEVNIGGANFNNLINYATAPYFMWAAHDDMWEPSYISKLINIMESDKSIVLAFSVIDSIDEDGKQIRVYPKILKLSSSETIFKRLFKFIMFEESDGKANLVYGIMRLNRLKEIGGFNKSLGEFAVDDLLLFSMLFKGNFYIIGELLFHKRRSLACYERRSLWVNISGLCTYFLGYHRIVATSKLDLFHKIALHFVTIFREVQLPMRFIRSIFRGVYLRCLRK